MTIEIRLSVMTPEIGVEKSAGEFPPGMGANPSATGRTLPGIGGTPTSSSDAKRLDTLENKTD